MVRERKNLSLDETLVRGVESMLKGSNVGSFSAYIEKLLAAHLIANNVIPVNYEPPGETRGGDRKSASVLSGECTNIEGLTHD